MRRIVILGGGYAGLHAWLAIQKKLKSKIRSGDVEVRMISKDPYHTYHGWSAEVLANRIPVNLTLTSLPRIIGDDYIEAEVSSIDLEKKSCILHKDGNESWVSFDHLLIATGSQDALDTIKGAREHAFRLKDTRDMQAFVESMKAHDDSGQSSQKLAVVGGGFAGVEMTSALALRYGPDVVSLIAGPRGPLGNLDATMSSLVAHARQVLTSQGVQVYNKKASEITSDGVLLEDGSLVSADKTLVAAGIAFTPIPGTESLAMDANKRLVCTSHLKIVGQKNIWAAGDIANVRRPGQQVECPIDALWAMKEGACAGENIARELKGKRLKTFGFKGMGRAAGLDHRNGISELHGFHFTGKLAWLLRVGFFLWYMPGRIHTIAVLKKLLKNPQS